MTHKMSKSYQFCEFLFLVKDIKVKTKTEGMKL